MRVTSVIIWISFTKTEATEIRRWPLPPHPIRRRRSLLVDEFDDLRNQLGRHDHDGLSLGQKSRLVFLNLLVFGLIVVVLGKLPDSLFIPARRVCLVFFGH